MNHLSCRYTGVDTKQLAGALLIRKDESDQNLKNPASVGLSSAVALAEFLMRPQAELQIGAGGE
jgi:hypothetical protein